MAKSGIHLPYVDKLLDRFSQADHDSILAFGRHMHAGYWADPEQANSSIEDFAQASEELCCRICQIAKVRKNMAVLDVGCGFGGTIANINSRFSPIKLVGLNIDPRQLQIASQQVIAQPLNSVEFIEGDACQLPFDDESFDVVLAIESILHFSNRSNFFQEAKRVLRPGGRLVLTDLVLSGPTQPLGQIMDLVSKRYVFRSHGNSDLSCSLKDYQAIAARTGLVFHYFEDITANTLPSYAVIQQLKRKRREKFQDREGATTMSILYWLSRLRFLRYVICEFQAQ